MRRSWFRKAAVSNFVVDIELDSQCILETLHSYFVPACICVKRLAGATNGVNNGRARPEDALRFAALGVWLLEYKQSDLTCKIASGTLLGEQQDYLVSTR